MRRVKIQRIDSSNFSYRNWEAGTIHEIIDGPCRYWNITAEENGKRLQKAVVGWCVGSQLPHKPKEDEVGIMCFHGGRHLWFHIRKNEFDKLFKEANHED